MSAAALRARLAGVVPRALVVLGSGLGSLADAIADPLLLAFGDLALPEPTARGHAGRFVAGTLDGVPVLVQQGRLHLYEGIAAADVTSAVRMAAEVGIGTLLVTNASGGLREDLDPGDVMLINDHLNLTGANPLAGVEDGPHFIDLAGAYDPGLREAARAAAREADTALAEGVYAQLVGPSYETPAEVRMLRTLGADAVGMSTVIEVIEARARGMRAVGLSLVTNTHREGGAPTAHAEVLAAAAEAAPRLARVVRALLPRL